MPKGKASRKFTQLIPLQRSRRIIPSIVPSNKAPGKASKASKAASKRRANAKQHVVAINRKQSVVRKLSAAEVKMKLAAENAIKSHQNNPIVFMSSRNETMPLDQDKPNCLQKSHARLLSNWIGIELGINDVYTLNNLTKGFDYTLSNYCVFVIGEGMVPDYGGWLQEVLGTTFETIQDGTYVSEKYLPRFFEDIDDVKTFINTTPAPDVESDDNVNDDNTIRMPGDPLIVASIQNFVNTTPRYDNNNNFFKRYIALDMVLTPNFYHWLGSLTSTTPDFTSPAQVICDNIAAEINSVMWDGEKYVPPPHPHPQPLGPLGVDLLQAYFDVQLPKLLDANGVALVASDFGDYPGHSFVIKGHCGLNDPVSGIIRWYYFVQNSWGFDWNPAGQGGRWIPCDIIHMTVYGTIRIVPVAPPPPVVIGGNKKHNKSKPPRKQNKTKKIYRKPRKL